MIRNPKKASNRQAPQQKVQAFNPPFKPKVLDLSKRL